MNVLFQFAACVGFLSSAIALYGRYKTLPAFLTGPNICRLEEGGCQVLFRTKNAALLGIPNSALGVLYYPLLEMGLTLSWPSWMLFGASTIALGMTLWLGVILIREKLECRVCWTGHVCNLIIWVVFSIRMLERP